MAQVKFFRGLKSTYTSNPSNYVNAIYFATDTRELLMGEQSYGMSADNSAILNSAFTNAQFVTPTTIRLSRPGDNNFVDVELPVANESQAGFMSAAAFTKLKGVEAGAQVNVIEDVTVDGAAGSISGKTLVINGGFAKAADVYTKDSVYNKSEVDQKLVAVYKFKGTKATYSELPSEGNVKGDVWNVAGENGLIPAGTNYAWDGEKWDALGGQFDTSALESRISANETAIAGNVTAIANEKSRAEGIEGGLRSDLSAAQEAIEDLQESIEAITGGSNGSGTISNQINTAVSNLKGDVENYDTLGKLEDAIVAEVGRAKQAESANAELVADEEERALAAEAGLKAQIESNDADILALQGADAALAGRVSANEAAIAKLDGAETVEGSVKKQVKDAVAAEAQLRSQADTALSNRIKAIEDSVGEGGSVAEDIQANADAIANIQKDYLKAADKTELQNNINTVSGDLTSHINDSVKHITADERAAWNAAQSNAKNYTDAEILKAKTYAEEQAAAVDGKLTTEVGRAKAAEKVNADAIAALAETVSTNENDIEGKVSGLSSRMTTAEGTIAEHTTKIGENAAAITAMDAAYKAADTKVKNDLVGTAADVATADTINGAKKYAASLLEWHDA